MSVGNGDLQSFTGTKCGIFTRTRTNTHKLKPIDRGCDELQSSIVSFRYLSQKGMMIGMIKRSNQTVATIATTTTKTTTGTTTYRIERWCKVLVQIGRVTTGATGTTTTTTRQPFVVHCHRCVITCTFGGSDRCFTDATTARNVGKRVITCRRR